MANLQPISDLLYADRRDKVHLGRIDSSWGCRFGTAKFPGVILNGHQPVKEPARSAYDFATARKIPRPATVRRASE